MARFYHAYSPFTDVEDGIAASFISVPPINPRELMYKERIPYEDWDSYYNIKDVKQFLLGHKIMEAYILFED